MIVIAILFYLIALVCGIIILIDAFKDSILKGFLCLLCGFYTLYYAFVEFDHEKKWPIVGAWIGSGVIGAVLFQMSQK